MKTKFLLFFLCAFVFTSCNSQNDKIENLPPKAYAEKIKVTPNAQILDVRTPGEFAGEHLENAVNVNWNGAAFASEAAKFDKSKPVFVYCKIGGRSGQAAAKLSEMGFTRIYDLEGGILKWNAAGLSKPDGKIIGMCSQEYTDMVKANPKVLVDFYAEWCAPCKKMTPYLSKMQVEMKDKITIVRLNADEHKTLISDMKIATLPALLLYENGTIKWEHKGFISEEDLKKQLQ